ncbi:hypothetical protein [Oerskovia flava]|uniref:hypothetical protein n=1 Tax=Oerskovia flava TaxID=2986422 RepID=UPI0022400806|nr:hypothetical protein [Oerskovia sp. JB1-3-2]
MVLKALTKRTTPEPAPTTEATTPPEPALPPAYTDPDSPLFVPVELRPFYTIDPVADGRLWDHTATLPGNPDLRGAFRRRVEAEPEYWTSLRGRGLISQKQFTIGHTDWNTPWDHIRAAVRADLTDAHRERYLFHPRRIGHASFEHKQYRLGQEAARTIARPRTDAATGEVGAARIGLVEIAGLPRPVQLSPRMATIVRQRMVERLAAEVLPDGRTRGQAADEFIARILSEQ